MLGTVSGTKEIYYKLQVITIHFFLLASPEYVDDNSHGRSNILLKLTGALMFAILMFHNKQIKE